MVIFLYNPYIFVWIQHFCLANTVFASETNKSVIKKLRTITEILSGTIDSGTE